MQFNPEIHRRCSIRLKGYDYFQAGAYFVTVCIEDRACLFGDIVEGEMLSNDAGRMVEMVWNEIPDHFPGAAIDGFQIMPNHIHGIVVIDTDGRGTACRAPTASVEQFGKPVSGSLPTIVRSFKSAVTRRINETRNAHGANYGNAIIMNTSSAMKTN